MGIWPSVSPHPLSLTFSLPHSFSLYQLLVNMSKFKKYNTSQTYNKHNPIIYVRVCLCVCMCV